MSDLVIIGIIVPCLFCIIVVSLQKNKMKDENQLKRSIGCVLLSKRLSMNEDGIKITQDDIATNSGISVRYYGKVERGEVMPSLYILMKIASTLQISLGELCKQVEEF